jgi:hypothetical protein
MGSGWLHDSAKPHTSHQTTKTLASLKVSFLPYLPYLSDSDQIMLSDEMKDPSQRPLIPDENLQSSACKFVRTIPKGWFATSIRKKPKRWQ